MIAAIVEALIEGAIAREVHRRGLTGRLVHLIVLDDERVLLAAAEKVGVVRVLRGGFL